MASVRWLRFLISAVAMLVISAAGSVAMAWCVDLADWVSMGLFAAMYAIVAVAGYVVASLWRRWPILRHVVFWVFLLLVEAPFLLTSFFPSPGALADGADQFAKMFLAPIAAGGVLAYAFDQWSGICDLERWTRRPSNACPSCGYPIGKSPVCTECGVALPGTRKLRSVGHNQKPDSL